ncbi:hypothetical protein [Paenibacillus agilis]|uniref:hypothetical protein n=1 Tax=Paenibacillus agilis TaxID=3020863 RepID=UPI001649BB92|nr:hypothetical protein [Paenibacillus agilis]
MCTGIALYGTEKFTPAEAFDIGSFPHLNALCEFSLYEVYLPVKAWLTNLTQQ